MISSNHQIYFKSSSHRETKAGSDWKPEQVNLKSQTYPNAQRRCCYKLKGVKIPQKE